MSPSDISTCRLLFHGIQDNISASGRYVTRRHYPDSDGITIETYLPVDCYSIGVRMMSPSDISTCRLLFHRSQDNVS